MWDPCLVIRPQRRPPRARDGGLDDPNTKHGPAPMRRGPWCRENERGSGAHEPGRWNAHNVINPIYYHDLAPVDRVMAILVTRLATAVSSRKTPKMAINRDFPGLRAFSANVARDKIEEQEIPHPMVKSAARFGAPKIQLWPF